ncbi:MAG: Lon family ATP-dependent protease [Nitrospirae bacterium]|nr:MAG: Lon family ATP-dependent protease [Nitrospirota bacterium]
MPSESSFASFEPYPIPEMIPVFPLPHVVFFPRTYLPLHIFEPRYRQMVKQAMTSGQCIGMALLKEGWEDNYYGKPAFYEIGCVGRLVRVYKLPDGRYNIVLHGLERCRYREEPMESSCRWAKISLHPMEGTSLDPQLRRRLYETVETYARAHQTETLIDRSAMQRATDPVLVHSLSAALDFTPTEKQFLLESETLTQQTRRLIDLLRLKLSATNAAQGQDV